MGVSFDVKILRRHSCRCAKIEERYGTMGMAAWQDLTCARLFLHLAVPLNSVSHPHGYFSVYGVSMDANEATSKRPQILAVMSESESKSRFCNAVQITHAVDEFCFDFFHVHGNTRSAALQSRLSLSPQHAKLLLSALAGNLGKYEKSFGQIREPGQQQPIGFRAPDK
jgi:hypothetical protein